MFSATVIQVIIASPSDVQEERQLAAQVVHDWNAINARKLGIVLLPALWETHSASDLSGRAQSQINERILKHCDLAVGIFWTRLGTPTGDYASGSVEEIEEHLKAGRPAMAFFSRKPVVPESIDPEEYKRVQEFKERCRSRGITWDYEDGPDFTKLFGRQLQIILNENAYFQEIGARAGTVTPNQMPTPSQYAMSILKSASEGGGRILAMRLVNGFQLQAGSKRFLTPTPRDVAEAEDALAELDRLSLVRSTDAKRQIFMVTASGYKLADQL